METIIGKEFPEKVIPLIKQAKSSIEIVVFNWYWYPDQIGAAVQRFNNAIIVAARRGVNVRVIISSDQIVNILSQNKVKAKKFLSHRTLHTKLMIIDDTIAILGSHNYTEAAFTTNYEVSIGIQEKRIVKRLKFYFENLWSY